jgi:hypothetical protein
MNTDSRYIAVALAPPLESTKVSTDREAKKLRKLAFTEASASA